MFLLMVKVNDSSIQMSVLQTVKLLQNPVSDLVSASWRTSGPLKHVCLLRKCILPLTRRELQMDLSGLHTADSKLLNLVGGSNTSSDGPTTSVWYGP